MLFPQRQIISKFVKYTGCFTKHYYILIFFLNIFHKYDSNLLVVKEYMMKNIKILEIVFRTLSFKVLGSHPVHKIKFYCKGYNKYYSFCCGSAYDRLFSLSNIDCVHLYGCYWKCSRRSKKSVSVAFQTRYIERDIAITGLHSRPTPLMGTLRIISPALMATPTITLLIRPGDPRTSQIYVIFSFPSFGLLSACEN